MMLLLKIAKAQFMGEGFAFKVKEYFSELFIRGNCKGLEIGATQR